MGFPIPDALQDLFNKILRKEDSISVREESPSSVDYTYKEVVYRGVPVKVLDQITVVYPSSKPTEIFSAVRDEAGTLLGSRKTQHYEPPGVLAP